MTKFEKYLKERNIPVNSLEANSIREGIQWTINTAVEWFNNNLTEGVFYDCGAVIKEVTINEFIEDFKQLMEEYL
jgi:hypothetical protein